MLLIAGNALCALLLWKLVLAPEKASAATIASPPAAGAVVPEPASAPVEAARAPEPVLAVRADPALEARLRHIVEEAKHEADNATKGKVPASAIHVSVHVREAGKNGELAALDADRAMRPASNLKLVTTAAALVLLGPEWKFTTRFESAAALANGVLQGDLVVQAGGDPLYDPEAKGRVDAFFAPVAERLRAAGIDAIDGALVLDEGDYLEPGPGPAWPPEKQHWSEFCGLCGGFNANAGCFTASVSAGSAGRAKVEVEPRWNGLTPKWNVDTIGPKGKLNVRVAAQKDTLLVEGSIPSGAPEWSARFAAPDPIELFGQACIGYLRSRGIRISGGLRRERNVRANLRELARLETPLANLLVSINTHSNNVCADQVFLALGHAIAGAGTRAGGSQATARALSKLGISIEEYRQVDGSGLSRDDRVSARMITALIEDVLRINPRIAELYVASLAGVSEDGTLEHRMKALVGRVHAKTGFIAGTSALSGIVEAEDGRALVFSILVEYPNFEGLNSRAWKPMEDQICEALAGLGRSN